jgi:hypothetical protein
VNKWKSRLAPWESFLCELACGSIFERHGYETGGEPGSIGQRALARILLPAVILLEKVYLAVIRLRLKQHGISPR